MKSQVKFSVIALILVGLVLISINYIAPHTLLIKKIVQVTHQIPIPQKTDTLVYKEEIYLDINSYESFPISLSAGQRLLVDWCCQTSSMSYLFTKSQFDDYLTTNLQHISAYEATSYVPRQYSQSVLDYNVTITGDYVLMIRNSKQGNSLIQDFNARVTTYNYQTQYTNEPRDSLENDNLYLYLGMALIVTVVIAASLSKVRKKLDNNH